MSPRILLVDDTESGRYIMSSWLRRAGFQVIEAATAAEALALADSKTDAVVLDVNLPDMSGLEVCRRLKEAPKTAAVPVLHVSATAVDVADRTLGLTSGADGYLIEPVEPDELIATVNSLLRYSAARRKAERLARQLGALTTTTLQVNAADTLADLLTAAAVGASQIFGAAVSVVAALDGSRAALVHEPADRTTGRVTPIPPSSVASVATAMAAMTPSAGSARDTGLLARHILAGTANAHLLPTSATDTLLVTALRSRSQAFVGAIVVAVEDTEDDGDALLARQLGQSVGVALENLRLYHEEHRIALTLQESLLPEALPDAPGLAFAARYIASSEQVSVGGDFYDAFALPDGGVGVAIGDIQGHSLQAATTMAELRYSLRAYAIEGHGPAYMLARLNEILMTNHPDETATALVMRFEPDRSRLTFANAGHLPPLLISGGQARYLENPSLLLGLPAGPATEQTVTLEPDALLVLTTDGLIERRGESLDAGLQRLAEAALAHAPSPDSVCESLIAQFSGTGVDDDIALLCVART